jgi:hypothetical protein
MDTLVQSGRNRWRPQIPGAQSSAVVAGWELFFTEIARKKRQTSPGRAQPSPPGLQRGFLTLIRCGPLWRSRLTMPDVPQIAHIVSLRAHVAVLS